MRQIKENLFLQVKDIKTPILTESLPLVTLVTVPNECQNVLEMARSWIWLLQYPDFLIHHNSFFCIVKVLCHTLVPHRPKLEFLT